VIAVASARTVDPVAAATYFVERLGFTAFPVYGARGGKCLCGDPHDGVGKHHAPENIGKHPATPQGFKNATSDMRMIRTFLGNPGTPNYGLNAPVDVLAIDVDGPDGLAHWAELERLYGPLPVTLTTLTANGRHYFFAWPANAGAMPTGKLFGFVTRRHDDGYVIGPGSVHVSGVVYDTLRQSNGMPYDIVEFPATWVEAAQGRRADNVITIGRRLPQVGERHDWLRDTARLYAGTVRDPDALKAAVMAENAKLAVPKSEAAVDAAIGKVLARFPADPTEPDPETGAPVRSSPEDVAFEILGASTSGAFPDPPAAIAFEGLCGDVVASLAAQTDASEAGLLATFLTMAGGVLAVRGYYHGDHPSGVMTTLVGNSSTGRKGTTTVAVWDALLSGMGAQYEQRFDGLNSGEGLVFALQEMQKGGAHAHAIMVEEEFSRILTVTRREGSTLDSQLRVAFDARPLQVRTRAKAANLRVDVPYCLAALCGITPKELKSLLTQVSLSNGSANRWLWVPVERREVHASGTSAYQLPYEVAQELRAAHEAAAPGGARVATSGAAAEILNAYGEFLTGLEGTAGDLSRRFNVIAFRLALTHAALERSWTVEQRHVDRSIALTEYARSGLYWVFGSSTGAAGADHLARRLADAGRLSGSDTYRLLTSSGRAGRWA
jgi:hypothetical protein